MDNVAATAIATHICFTSSVWFCPSSHVTVLKVVHILPCFSCEDREGRERFSQDLADAHNTGTLFPTTASCLECSMFPFYFAFLFRV